MNNPTSTDPLPHICFVALKCYGHLTGKFVGGTIGGAEVQQVMMARWLAQNGFRVSFVTFDHGQPDGEDTDGITVFKAYDLAAGKPGLRFFTRWLGVWRAMKRAGADVYYQRSSCAETGQVALWCRLHRRPFVFGIACEGDCTFDTPTLEATRERWLYGIGLRLANRVIAQTMRQQELLRESVGMESVLLRSSSATQEAKIATPSRPPEILWVGRIGTEKRLEWLIDIAAACPGYHFKVVGAANQASEYENSLLERATALPNMEIVGPVPFSRMPEYYASCFLVCSTSPMEGFPNIFIEAWQRGIPVLSAYDPDGVIEREGLGWVCGSVERMVEVLNRLQACSEIRDVPATRARRYYESNHTREVNMPILAGYLEELLDRG